MEEPRQLRFDIQVPDASSRNLVCHEWGDPRSPRTVLCVHGLTRNGRDFDFLARALADRCRVLCPDMPGRGQSGWLPHPEGYANAAYAGDIAWMLRSLGVARVTWIGTSMGGIVGMLAAGMLPGVIEALVLNDIGCVIPAAGLARIRDLGRLPVRYPGRAEAEAACRLRCAGFGITGDDQWRHIFAHGLKENPDGTVAFTYDPAIFSGLLKEEIVADIDLWPLWEAVTAIPALLIRGERSDLLPRETALEMKVRHPALLVHEVAGAGHAPSLMENREIERISGWIT